MAVKLGYKNVYRDPKGFPDWAAAGFPVETTSRSLEATRKPEAGGQLYGWAMIWTLLGVFAGGLALNLTPCVYPLIPITVSFFGGRSGQSRGRLAVHGVLYIGGLAATNSLLGVTAALTGSLMGDALRHPATLIFVTIALVFFAASLFGFWEMRLPSALTGAASKARTGYFGSLFMGLTLGIVAAPCLGPFVLGLLTWVASLGSPWLGFLIFFTLSMGLGLPLFLLAMFSGSIEKLPGSGEWMLWVRKVMGWVLIGMAAYFLQPLLPSWLGVLLIAAVCLAAGLHLGWLDETQTASRSFRSLRTVVGAVGVIICVYLALPLLTAGGPGISWKPYSRQVMEEARHLGKPVILDFYADWCAPCREMEYVTFRNPEIIKQTQRFIMVKADLTAKGDPALEHLVREYSIKGVPSLIFLDANGRELTDLRVGEFMPADQFLSRMIKVEKGPSSGS